MDKIIDSHCHFGSSKEGIYEARLKDFIELNKKYNAQFILAVFIQKQYAQMMEEIQELAKVTEEQDIFLGVSVTMSRNEPDKAIELVKTLPSSEILALKPLYIGKNVPIDSAASDKIVQLAIELGIPLFYHCSHETPSDVLQVGKLASRFPKAKLIIGHFGGSRLPFGDTFESTIKVFKENKNTYLDTSTPMAAGLIERAVKIDSNRILFGTDFPVHYFGSQYALVGEAKISELDKKKIFYDNARQLFKF